MQTYRYTIILYPDADEGAFTVRVPALPGIVTQGKSIEEAIAMGREAIGLYIESLIADGEPVPVESDHPQAITVEVAA